jgi:hypothetical protein
MFESHPPLVGEQGPPVKGQVVVSDWSDWIVQVDPGDLYRSAMFIDPHAQDIQYEHGIAQTQIESAQSGLVGASAAAIAEKAADWRAVTQVLYARLSRHGAAFQSCGRMYENGDHDNAIQLGRIGAEGSRTMWN